MYQFSYARPEEMGISSNAIEHFLNTLEDNHVEMHSFMLLRHGHVVSKGWWDPYTAQDNHMLFSLSKSFTSTAVGFAVQEGLLSVEDKVLSFFPELLPAEPCENMKKLTVKNLLTMSTGHTAEPRYNQDAADWVYTFLTSYIEKEPGTYFLYNTAATYILSAIVQKVTGMTIHEYLTPRFFEPLGIENTWWEKSPEGVSTGGYGLNVKTEDIAKLGQFYLNKGKWNGEQLLNPEWIEAASAAQVPNYGATPDWASGYGYQFWQCVPNKVFRGDGAFGQFCVIMPEQDAVLAITSGVMDMQKTLNIVWECLLPEMKEEALPLDDAAWESLQEKTAGLVVTYPKGDAKSDNAKLLCGNTYSLSANELGIDEVSFDFSGETPALKMVKGDLIVSLKAGYQNWVRNEIEGVQDRLSGNIGCAGAWSEDGVYHVTLQYINTPFGETFTFRPLENAIEITWTKNVGETGENLYYGILKK